LKPKDNLLRVGDDVFRISSDYEIRSRFLTSTKSSGDDIITEKLSILSLHHNKERLVKIVEVGGFHDSFKSASEQIGRIFNILATHHKSNHRHISVSKGDFKRSVLYDPDTQNRL